MKRLFYSMIFVLGLANGSHGEIIQVKSPEVANLFGFEAANPDVKDKVWNRWTSKNFVVCSIDDAQAKYLHENLEDVRGWVFKRWGLPDLNFSRECRLICVNDLALFKTLFGIDHSKVEVRREENGSVKMTTIFLLCEERPSQTIPAPLTEVCLIEMEQQYHLKFGWWFHRGSAALNGSLSDIRRRLADLRPSVVSGEPKRLGLETHTTTATWATPTAKSLFEMTEKEWNELDEGAKKSFDSNAMAASLFLRKEFGRNRFTELLRTTARGERAMEATIQKVCGMDYAKFDSIFKKYLQDLTGAITGQTGNPPPDSYLQINSR